MVSSSCVANVLRANVTALPSGSNTLTLTATMTRISNSLTRVTTANFNQQFFCPPGYVGVPGKFATDSDTAGLGNVNASAGNANAWLDPTKDFCVMKYPAKAATSNSGGQSPWEEIYNGRKIFTMDNLWPQSRAAGTPWTNLDRYQAEDRCWALNEAYGLCSGTGCSSYSNSTQGFRLMSNTQWQVVARNIENTGANWTSGTVGSGYLWRGHSDNVTGSDAWLHSQDFDSQLSNPRFDGAATDYFGTGNTVAENWSGEAGWQERRRFVLSSGASVWDMSGNVWQWVSDDNDTGTGAGGEMGVSSAIRALSYWMDFDDPNLTASDLKIIGSSGGYTSSKNVGQIYVRSNGAVIRGGGWQDFNLSGLFSALGEAAWNGRFNFGFRCAFVPPPLTGPVDTSAPTVTLQRTTSTGTALGSNNAITVAAGGFWHLGFAASDAENTGANANKLWVQVRRKIANGQSNADYPTLTDAVYREGYLPTFQLPNTYTGTAAYGLADETAWTLDPVTLKYTRNDSKYVNYLVTVIDPSGNKSDATVGNGGTISINNTQSCPQGYVGVPSMNGSGSAWNDPAVNAGLGNTSATAGNSNKGLDISKSFCVMKFPAKIQSANTTVAASFVGGKLEPIANGNETFSQVSTTYTNAATFDTNIRYLPDSRPSGTPWVNISRDNSINACRSLQMGYLSSMPDTSTGTGFQLISNTQWQMMARNAEAQAANWSNNAVGSGVLSRGHSDNIISATEELNSWCFYCTAPSTSISAAPNSINDFNVYFATGSSSSFATWNTLGTSPAAGAEQRRNNVLSNGATLSDLGGNVSQWVSDNRTSLGIPAGDNSAGLWTSAWISFRNGGANRFSATGNLIFGNFGSGGLQFSEVVNAGMIFGGNSGALLRGTNWYPASSSGLFAANLAYTPTYSAWDTGFRCVFVP